MDILKSSRERKQEKIIRGFRQYLGSFLEFTVLITYLEVIFHILFFKKAAGLLYPIILGLPVAAVLALLTEYLPGKGKKAARIVLYWVNPVLYGSELVYYGVFRTFFAPFSMMQYAGQAMDFRKVVFHTIGANFVAILLLLLPAILLTIWECRKKYKKRSVSGVCLALQIAFAVVCYLFSMVSMIPNSDDDYSAQNLYHQSLSTDISIEKLGVWTTIRRDFMLQFGKGSSGSNLGGDEWEDPEKNSSDNPKESDEIPSESGETQTGESESEDNPVTVPVDTSPNVMDIDFESLIASETDETVKQLHEYFSKRNPTNKNAYTGMFEGYNVIFITAEGFSKYVVDEERTPLLYQMATEGFDFENFYTPIYYGSTSAGEYANLTGMLPNDGGYLSMKYTGENKVWLPFTLAHELGARGYTTAGFHNGSYTYYGRDITHPNLGYDTWIGGHSGFEMEKYESGSEIWPQSDEYMVKQLLDQMIPNDGKPFHTYFMTVSGHLEYAYKQNGMSSRHSDLYQDLPYSETVKAYLACQYELELAMRALLEGLEERGLADKTLFVLSADHIPYSNKEMCDELEGHTMDETMEWPRNRLIIWSASMKEPVKVTKYCESIDILPTVLNLLGIEYDSRLIVGRDIMSDSEGFIIFPNRSFISDTCSYNNATKEIVSFTGEEVSEDYIKSMRTRLRDSYEVSKMIIESDYFSHIPELCVNKPQE